MASTAAKNTVATQVPPLADTDVELWTDCLGDYISAWLKNSQNFFNEQQEKMYRMALCPFLFGVSRNLPQAWLEVLRTYGIVEKDRENITSPLSELQLETLDMAETVFMRCSQLASNKNDLKTILNFIHDVEDRSALSGRIDMNYALQEVSSLEVFSSMWAPIKRIYEKRKRQAHVCIIYYFKIISYHIIQYGQNGIDRADFVESMLFDLFRPDQSEVTIEEARKTFDAGNYRLAVEQYSALIEKEPLNSCLYDQRSEAYLQLSDYWAALSDCRRAIVLKPTDYLHYYKAAKLYLELGQLEKAEDFGHQSLEHATDPSQRAPLDQLTQDIRAARGRMTRVREASTSSGSEERDICYTQYRKLICEGSELHLSHVYGRAAEQFKAALDVIARSTSEELSIEGDDLAFIWLVYGLSCVKAENTRNVPAAIEKFNTIISRTAAFPAAFYGLALAYVQLKRYQEAGAVLVTGLARLADVRACYWPGTNILVEETVGPTLKKLMEDLLKETKFPPKPDAVCKFHVDTDNLKKEMYFSDPDYKGHVCIKCRANCSLDCHAQCWRPSDCNSRGKHNWKEVLDTPCPTPECWGTISEVLICRPDPDKTLKLSSQLETQPQTHQPRPKLKMKTASPSKLERKMEMKRLRKEKRQEARQEFDDQQASEEQLETTSTRIILPADDEVVNVNIDRTGTVLRKDEPEMMTEKKQKVSKSKKKEKKQKQFLAVDLQFKGDDEKERYGINSLDDDGDAVNSPDIGLLPTPGSESSSSPSPSQPFQQAALEIALYEFFYKIILAKGPLDLMSKELEDHTKHLCEEAQAYILSYGGLGKFLGAHHQFFVSQNNTVSALPASLLGTPPLKPLLAPQVNPGLMTQVKPLLVPQVKPLLASQVKPLMAPQVKPLMAPVVNLGSRPQVKPLMVAQVKPLLAVQVIPSLMPQINAWETRQSKPTEAQHARTGQGQGLNPGAKEFVPLDTAGAPVLPNSQQGGPEELADSCAEDLPLPAADDDDGFTTVVNKRRTNIQKLPSVVQPNVHKFAFLKPASSINSLDDIPVDSALPQRVQASLGAGDGDQPQVEGGRHRRMSCGNISSLDNFWEDASDMQLGVGKGKTKLMTGVMSPVTNKPSAASDVSDISWADLQHRVSSPALSTNSSCSSGRAEGLQASNQMSSQPAAPRPLKAPSILLPTRGKNKRPLAPKLYGPQQLLVADGSHDGCEQESVSSTTSDRDSTCGDARAASTDKLHMPPVTMSSGKDRTSVVREAMSLSSGSDVFSSSTRDSSLRVQHPSSGMEKKVVGGSGVAFMNASDSDGMTTKSQGFGAEIPGWGNMWPESPTAEKVPLDSSLSDLKVMVKSGKAAVKRQEKNKKAVFDNLASQAAGPQTQAQMFNLVTKRSDQSEVSMKTVPDATWSSWGWGLPESYGKVSDGEDVRVPPSDPWHIQDQATAPASTDLFGESPELPTMSANTPTSDVNHQHSNKDNNSGAFYVGPFSRECGLIGSGKLKDNDPWSSRSVVSPTSLSADISFHSHRSTASPFPAWMPAHIPSSSTEPRLRSSSATEPSVYISSTSTEPMVYKSGTSTEPSMYTSNMTTEPSVCASGISAKPSVSITESSTESSGTIIKPLSFTTATSSGSLLHRSLTKPSLNRSVIEPTLPLPSFAGAAFLPKNKHPEQIRPRTNEGRIVHPWEQEQVRRGNTDLMTVQCRSVDTQTGLSGAQVEDMLESCNLLKDSRAQLASVLHEKLQLQEQLSLERSANDQLRQDHRRLLTKFHVAEASAEKWKDDCSRLMKNEQLLNAQVQAQTETICQLTTQMDQLKTECLNAQMDALTMKKELTNSQLDLKQQEALHHYHRLSNLIVQSKTSDKKLPESVYEKLTEFSEYIASCDNLSRHVEVVYLRLAGDLQRGQMVDMAELQLSPPTFPKSPTEPSERPQASTNSLPHVDANSLTHIDINSLPHVDTNSLPHVGTNSLPHVDTNSLAHVDTNSLPHVDTNSLPHVDTNSLPHVDTNSLPHVDTNSLPHVGTNSLPHVDTNSEVQPSPAPSLTSAHSSPSRAHSSLHSSPSPPDVSSLHSSPSRSGSSGHTSSSCSTTSGQSLSPHGRESNRSSPALARNHQMPAWSALKPEAQPQDTENDDADAYLKMIYGGSSSADPLTKVTGATAAPNPQDIDHKKKAPDPAGRQGWNPASSRLLPSPARLPAPNGRVPQGGLGSRILPGPTQSRLAGERARTTSVPNMRTQSKPHTSHSGPGQNQQQLPYFERIVQTVQDKLPDCSRSEIQKVVDTLRRNSGGTLSGWTFEALANEILEMILDLEQGQNLATFTDWCGPDEQSPTSIWEYETTDRTCSICQCVVQPSIALTLSCGHTFHEACAQQWLTNERSCPNCRSHAFLSQDFPVLK